LSGTSDGEPAVRDEHELLGQRQPRGQLASCRRRCHPSARELLLASDNAIDRPRRETWTALEKLPAAHRARVEGSASGWDRESALALCDVIDAVAATKSSGSN
jgi:hypothetical protein